MKKKFILIPFIGALVYLVLCSYSEGPASYGSVEGTGATGSAGCSCHNSFATSSTNVSIQLLSGGSPVTAYTPGSTYTITITGTQTSSSLTLPRFGFQLAVVKSSGAGTSSAVSAGSMSGAPTGTHLYTLSGRTIFEHYNGGSAGALPATTGTGGSGTTYVESITWTAPSSGTGSVVVYGTINAVNYNGTDDAGDKWNNTSLTIPEAVGSISGTTSLCALTTTSLSCTPSGGTWSSSNTSVATVTSTGVVTGVATGTAIITYNAGTSGNALATVTVNPLPTAPFGTMALCATTTTTLGDITPGGTWSSGATGVATVTSSSGVVTGVSAGTSVISYTTSTFGCSSTSVVTVYPLPGAITGTANVCTGATAALTDAGGGTWASSNTGVATVGTGSGIVFGVSAGTSVITYTLSTGCFTVTTVTVNPAPGAITGTMITCPGFTVSLTDAGGGTWSSGSTAVATVVSGTGVVTGVSGGTSVITYTLSTGCTAVATVTINPAPATIAGGAVVCQGSTISLSDATAGGTWSSGSSAIATVNSSGVVTGVAAGTATITYTLTSTGCITTTVVTVNSLPSSIIGPSAVCAGSNTTLTDAGGGTWSSSTPAVATIGASTGFLQGVSAGSSIITYTLPTGCYTTQTEAVNPLPSAISGAATVCAGSSTALTDAGGGTWSSSNTLVATISSTTGIMTGVSSGPVTITYTLPSTGCRTTTLAIVNSVPAIISGSTSVCVGSAVTVSDATGGGTWSSSDATIASVGSTTPIISGIAAGTATITYKLIASGCYTTQTETVIPLPPPVSGSLGICQSSTATLTDAAGAGTWSSSNTTIVSIGSGSGVITANVAGTSIITFTAATGCRITATATVYALPVAVSGGSSVCTGSTITLSDASGGGTWSSSNTAIATAASSTGVITGVSAGSAAITFTLPTGCITTKTITVTASPSAITGTATVCAGQVTALTDGGGGTWASSNTAIATVNSSGVVTGVSGGSATITYSLSGCIATQSVVVNPLAPISGLSSMCSGLTATLSDAVTGGTWSSSNTSVATIVSSTGFLSGVGPGTSVISYTLSTGCTSLSTLTVVSAPGIITGNTSVCLGSTSSLTNAGGGTWTSSNSAVATAGLSTGIISGVALGTANITYSLGTGCVSVAAVTVNSNPAAISGTAVMCEGATVSLSDITGGGTWSSGNTSVATVGTGAGLVAGVAGGSSAITYMLGTGCTAVKIVTVHPAPSSIFGNLSVCTGSANTLTDGLSGGTWASGATAIASIVSGTGVVSGIVPGTAGITYTLPTSCSATAVVTVNALPSVYTITGGGSYCVGDTGVHIGLSGSSAGVNYSWYIGSSSGTAVGTGGAIDFGLFTAAGTYTVAALNPATGCSRVMGTVVVTANPLPTIFTVTGGGTYCSGGSGVHIGLSSSSSGVTYKLFNGSTVVSTLSGGGSSLDFGAITAAGTYTVSAAIAATGCADGMAGSTTVTINPLPNPYVVTGGGSYCSGGSGVHIGLANSDAGIRYQLRLGSSIVSTMNGTGGGIDFGLITAAGSYSVVATDTTTLCTNNMIGGATVTISPLPAVIAGLHSVCAGSTITLSDGTAGGTWISSNTAVATVGSGTGIVTGVSAGTTIISYVLSTGCGISDTITVNPVPLVPSVAGAGSAAMCAGSSITLTDATSGGTWVSSSSTVAAAGSAGVITGVAAGTAAISYELSTGCSSTISVTVNIAPAAISGPAAACTGVAATLTDAVSGGTWTSSNTSVASVGASSGILSGIAVGTTVISYTLADGCATARSETVNLSPNAGTIIGATHQCFGSPLTLSDAAAGGSWSSSNVSVATVGATTGIVSGVSAGIVTITYSVTNVCGTAIATALDTVISLPSADTLLGADSVCVGGTINLSDSAAGGSWSSSNSSVASVNSTGLVTGVSAGSATISYSITTPCGIASATLLLTVKSLAACNTGVNGLVGEAAWKVYPNPSDGRFIIELSPANSDAVVIVEDMLGKKVFERNAGHAVRRLNIDLGSTLVPGSYLLKVFTGGQVLRQKIVVAR